MEGGLVSATGERREGRRPQKRVIDGFESRRCEKRQEMEMAKRGNDSEDACWRQSGKCDWKSKDG